MTSESNATRSDDIIGIKAVRRAAARSVSCHLLPIGMVSHGLVTPTTAFGELRATVLAMVWPNRAINGGPLFDRACLRLSVARAGQQSGYFSTFVMNSEIEIREAIDDFNSGRFARATA
jgi:hypothetical protein